MTIPGSSRTSGLSEDGRERRRRRAWLVALWLYALAAAADAGFHLNADRRAGRDWLAPASLVVAIPAGLFWPLDLVAHSLLAG